MHRLEGFAYAQEQHHEVLLGESGVVDQVGVDHVLEVTAAIVRQEDVHRLGGLVGAALGRHGMVVCGYDSGNVREEAVRVDFAHGELDGFGAKGASDLLEGEELVRRRVFYEVDV